MSDHRKRLRRLSLAQKAIADSAALDHAIARSAKIDSEADANKIIESLNEDSPLHGLLTGVIAGALTRNAAQTANLSTEAKTAAERENHERLKAEALQKREQTATRLERRRAQRLSIEFLVSRPRNEG